MLLRRRFWPMFVAVTMGSFADYYFKSAFISMVAFNYQYLPLPRNTLIILTPLLLLIPFLLLSSLAGSMSDHYPKARQIQVNKAFAFLIMLAGAWFFYFDNWIGILFVLVGIGVEITQLGPLKFAILPYHFKHQELLSSNALLNLGTFMAIFCGTLAGNYSVTLYGSKVIVASVLIITSGSGLLASWLIPFSGQGNSHKPLDFHFMRSTRELLINNWRATRVRRAIFSNSWFWFFTTYYFTYIPIFVRDGLKGKELTLNFVLFAFSAGIGLGSVGLTFFKRVHPLSTCQLSLLLAGLGSLVLAVLQHYYSLNIGGATNSNDMVLSSPLFLPILLTCFWIAVGAGSYTVPIQTFIQQSAQPSHLSRTIAGANISDAFFMILASLVLLVVNFWQVQPSWVFLAIGLMVLLSIWALPLPTYQKADGVA